MMLDWSFVLGLVLGALGAFLVLVTVSVVMDRRRPGPSRAARRAAGQRGPAPRKGARR